MPYILSYPEKLGVPKLFRSDEHLNRKLRTIRHDMLQRETCMGLAYSTKDSQKQAKLSIKKGKKRTKLGLKLHNLVGRQVPI